MSHTMMNHSFLSGLHTQLLDAGQVGPWPEAVQIAAFGKLASHYALPERFTPKSPYPDDSTVLKIAQEMVTYDKELQRKQANADGISLQFAKAASTYGVEDRAAVYTADIMRIFDKEAGDSLLGAQENTTANAAKTDVTAKVDEITQAGSGNKPVAPGQTAVNTSQGEVGAQKAAAHLEALLALDDSTLKQAGMSKVALREQLQALMSKIKGNPMLRNSLIGAGVGGAAGGIAGGMSDSVPGGVAGGAGLGALAGAGAGAGGTYGASKLKGLMARLRQSKPGMEPGTPIGGGAMTGALGGMSDDVAAVLGRGAPTHVPNNPGAVADAIGSGAFEGIDPDAFAAMFGKTSSYLEHYVQATNELPSNTGIVALAGLAIDAHGDEAFQEVMGTCKTAGEAEELLAQILAAQGDANETPAPEALELLAAALGEDADEGSPLAEKAAQLRETSILATANYKLAGVRDVAAKAGTAVADAAKYVASKGKALASKGYEGGKSLASKGVKAVKDNKGTAAAIGGTAVGSGALGYLAGRKSKKESSLLERLKQKQAEDSLLNAAPNTTETAAKTDVTAKVDQVTQADSGNKPVAPGETAVDTSPGEVGKTITAADEAYLQAFRKTAAEWAPRLPEMSRDQKSEALMAIHGLPPSMREAYFKDMYGG